MSHRGNPYKQKFKGIENFLRRVAFNLGNTPSQTEVKIISCIPIDVTDLQQKINTLEKELREVKCTPTYKASVSKHAPTRPTTPVIQTVLGRPNPIFSKSKNKVTCKCSQAKVAVANQACNTKSVTNKRGFRRKKSSVCIVSSFTSSGNKELYRFKYSDTNVAEVLPPPLPERISKMSSKIVPKRLQKVLKKKPRRKTHLVYFAQTLNTPFNSHAKSSDSLNVKGEKKSLITRSYINDIIRKQYDHELIVDKLTDISQFSSPVCRDYNCRDYESDVSWSYDKYEDLDKCLNKRNNFNVATKNNLPIDPGPLYHRQRNCYDHYYNSDDYDLYPVKEKPIRQKNEEVSIKQFKKFNIECWPESIRTKHNDLSNVNYIENTIPVYNTRYQPRRIYYRHADECTASNIRRKRNRIIENETPDASEPKIFSVDYGNVYAKRNLIPNEKQKSKKISPTFKNAECVTVNTNNTECQTVESKAVQLDVAEDNKAQCALNQIKTILQTVLTEVKTNIKSNNAVTKPKRDVVIQKDISHNNITYGSTLLNSFTYNPSYNINPCVASYPRQIPNYCYANIPSVPMKYLQNYPLVLPTIKHQDCQCQYNIQKEKPKTETKAAATEPTEIPYMDDDTKTSQKNETVNLINEIYKSIALNVNYSKKTVSRISIGCQKKTKQAETNKKKQEIILEQNTEEKETQFETPALVLTCNTENDNTYTTMGNGSTKSEASSESTKSIPSETAEEDKDTSEQVENETTDLNESKDEEYKTGGDSSISEDTLVADDASQKKEKSGLLQKVLKTVKIFKRRNHRMQNINMKEVSKSDSESATESNSVYSYKTYTDVKKSDTEDVEKSYTKPSLTDRDITKNFQENSRKLSPYMEQEYRRYWDEKLMFHENESPVHSSEKSFPGRNRSPESPMFYRGYEAKSAILRKKQSKIPRDIHRRYEPVQRERTGLKLEWLKKQK